MNIFLWCTNIIVKSNWPDPEHLYIQSTIIIQATMLGAQGTDEDLEATEMLVGNAQNLMQARSLFNELVVCFSDWMEITE